MIGLGSSIQERGRTAASSGGHKPGRPYPTMDGARYCFLIGARNLRIQKPHRRGPIGRPSRNGMGEVRGSVYAAERVLGDMVAN